MITYCLPFLKSLALFRSLILYSVLIKGLEVMDRKEFKQILNECLVINGFLKKGKYYYKDSSEVICSLAFQKSNYSNSYYVNVGIILKEINQNIGIPSDTHGDIRCRFCFRVKGKEVDSIDLDTVNDSSVIISSLEKGISEIVNPSLELKSLKKLLKEKPTLLYQTTIAAKQYLGFED